MTKDQLQQFCEEEEINVAEFQGKCHDCGEDITVVCNTITGERTGGAVYCVDLQSRLFYAKCDDCYVKDPILRNYKECEVYSRCVGYLRPKSQYNPGKLAEANDRKMFKLGKNNGL